MCVCMRVCGGCFDTKGGSVRAERDLKLNAKAKSEHVQRREKLETQQVGFYLRNSQLIAHVL